MTAKGASKRRLKLPPVAPVVRIVAVAIAFLLGVYGFSLAYADQPGGTTLAGNGFKSLRLVVGNFPADLEGRDLPLVLHVARWALPLLTFWSTIALAWIQLRNPIRLALMRARGDHLIVTGDAGLAGNTATAALLHGRHVLLWPADARADWVRDAADAGAAQVEAKGDDRAVDELGLDKARLVALLGPDDTANIGLAAMVVDQAAKCRPAGDPVDVITRVDDLDLRRSVEERFEGIDRASARVRFASVPDIAARQLFIDRPLDRFRHVGATQRIVFVLGFSTTIERYILRLLAGGHFRDGGKPRFIVATRDGEAVERGFRARNPGADTLAPLTFETQPVDQPAFAATLITGLTERNGAPVAILIDSGGDAPALALALAIDNHYRKQDRACPPIHVRMAGGHDGRLGVSIFPFGGLESLADPELLLQERHDALARSIHDFYLEGRLDEGEAIGARASMQEWEDLAESFRDDNRLVADCYQLKLRDIGARLAGGSGPTLRLEGDELEELARAEHDRWMAAKLSGGWRYGPVRDDRARIHPDILPYDDLSERIKDLDREQVRIMTRLLAASGHRALRALRVALDPQGGQGMAAAMATVLAHLAESHPDRIIVVAGAIGDGASVAALEAARTLGALVQGVAAANIQNLIDGADAAARDILRAVAREADCIHALTAPEEAEAFLQAHADFWLTGDDAAGTTGPPTAPTIRVAADGSIKAAPWVR